MDKLSQKQKLTDLLKEEHYTDQEIEYVLDVFDKRSELGFELNDIKFRLPYRQRQGEFKTTIHWGQRKLFLTTLLFLVKYHRLSDLVVYAGAAPGTNINLLSHLFKNLRFDLYDPQKFDDYLSENDKIRIFREYFTDETAAKYSDKNVLFISDIRTGTVDDPDFENQITENNNMQRRWHDIIRPVRGMYKFRLPYQPVEGGKEIDAPINTVYMKGKIWLQPWAPRTSTETRLIVRQKYKLVSYDNKEYEDKMYYFNIIMRQWMSFNSVYKPSLTEKKCHCFDCCFEKYILNYYITQTNIRLTVAELSQTISDFLGNKTLTQIPHGICDDNPIDKFNYLRNTYRETIIRERTQRTMIRKKIYDPRATKILTSP